MGRLTFMVDTAQILRPVATSSFGANYLATHVLVGAQIPCRLDKPTGDEGFEENIYRSQTNAYTLHLNATNASGIAVQVGQADLLEMQQYVNGVYRTFAAPFRIMGSIQPQMYRSQLVSYLIPVLGPEDVA